MVVIFQFKLINVLKKERSINPEILALQICLFSISIAVAFQIYPLPQRRKCPCRIKCPSLFHIALFFDLKLRYNFFSFDYL